MKSNVDKTLLTPVVILKGLSNKHVNNYNSCIDSDTWHTYFKGLFNRETGDVVDEASIFDNLTREVNADELNIQESSSGRIIVI